MGGAQPSISSPAVPPDSIVYTPFGDYEEEEDDIQE